MTAARFEGDIFIRLAKDGESYAALNGKEYTFDAEMIVLGDDHGVDDRAGIMGGERSGCEDDTTEMFLEAAIFDPIRVAATGRKLGIHSDARYRFERGLDPTSPWWGTEVATRLVLEICGGGRAVRSSTAPSRLAAHLHLAPLPHPELCAASMCRKPMRSVS